DGAGGWLWLPWPLWPFREPWLPCATARPQELIKNPARVSASNQTFAFLLMPFLLFRLVPYPLKGITSPSQTYLGTPCWPVSSSLLSLRFLAGRLQVPGKLDALRSEEHTSELQSRGHLV